jgi:hypothetical protein
MGSTFTIHRRKRSTDAYAPEDALSLPPHLSDDHALGVLKHETYALALQQAPTFADVKSVYLYQGPWRLARVERFEADGRVACLFRSARLRNQFMAAEERLAPQRWPLQERRFLAKFDTIVSMGRPAVEFIWKKR